MRKKMKKKNVEYWIQMSEHLKQILYKITQRPCSRKCLRTMTCTKTISGQILVLSSVLDHVLT